MSARLTAAIAIIATCLQVPMLISMLFLHDVALTEDEQVVLGGRRIAMDKKKDDESKGYATPTQEKDLPIGSR